jgi:hypothetical protein
MIHVLLAILALVMAYCVVMMLWIWPIANKVVVMKHRWETPPLGRCSMSQIWCNSLV